MGSFAAVAAGAVLGEVEAGAEVVAAWDSDLEESAPPDLAPVALDWG